MRRLFCAFLAAAVLFGLPGCAKGEKQENTDVKLNDSFETTARVKYHELETVMTIYKKPMNCAIVGFESPDSLKDIKMTFYTDKVRLKYKELHFDFTPGTLPGEAASRMILSAVNTALDGSGVSVMQDGSQLVISGQIEQGAFALTVDEKNGNILKLSIPEQELEMEVLNFKILE